MSQQIRFYNKSWCDIDFAVTATASEGQAYAYLPFNRNNQSAWQTTGSSDAANTTYEVDFGQPRAVDRIMILIHNFKAFTIKYWNGTIWADFSDPVSKSNNVDESSFFRFASVQTTKLKLTITACMVADAEKFLYQFIACSEIGQFDGWPVISKHKVSRARVVNRMLSGKSAVYENRGYFSCSLSVERWTSDHDLAIIEELYDSNEAFLVSLCGGDEDQFKTIRQGYRLEDVYLMKCVDDLALDYAKGIYVVGVKFSMDLMEATT